MTQDEDDFGSISVYPRDISAHDFSKGGYKSENVTDSNKGFNVVSRWYGYGGYYLVHYYGADGHKLKRPEVTYFTVKDDVDSDSIKIDAPTNVLTSVSSTGGLRVTWDKVDDAQKYKVYMSVVDTTDEGKKNGENEPGVYLLGTVKGDKTTFDSTDFDAERKEATKEAIKFGKEHLEDTGSPFYQTVTKRNYQFQSLTTGSNEDDIYQNRQEVKKSGGIDTIETDSYVPDSHKVKRVSVSVVAVNGKRRSPFRFKSINNLLGDMPIQAALWTSEQQKKGNNDQDALKSFMVSYVTMADGSTKRVPNNLNFKKAILGTNRYTYRDGHTEDRTFAYIPYTIDSGLLDGDITLDMADFGNDFNQVKTISADVTKQVEESNAGTGAFTSMPKIDDSEFAKLKTLKVSDKMPKVPYKVNGSSKYVKYVAANLLAGDMAIDITECNEGVGTPAFSDVLSEALLQNPLILASIYSSRTYTSSDGHTVACLTLNDLPDPPAHRAQGAGQDVPRRCLRGG